MDILPFSWARFAFSSRTRLIVESVILSVVIRLLALVSPFAVQTIIDRILPYERAASLSIILVLLLCTALFEVLLGYVAGRLGSWIGTGIGRDLSLRAMRHILHLPLPIIRRWPTGELLARLGELGKVQSFMGYTSSGLMLDAGFALVYAAVLATISPFLTAVLLLAMPVQLALYFVFGPLERRRFDRSFLAGSFHNARLIETFSHATTLKALGAEHAALQRLDHSLTDSVSKGLHASNLALLGRTLSGLADKTLNAIVIFAGARAVLTHDLTLGQLVAFQLLSGHVSGAIFGLARVWDAWQNVQVARRRLGELLLQPTEPEVLMQHGKNLSPSGPLDLVELGFSYPSGSPIISSLTASIPPLGITLVVGPSGCGKTTLAKLLTGLLAPTAGAIHLAGQPTAMLPPAAYRRIVAYVPQTPELFNGSIRDNLRLAAAADEESLWQALARAQLNTTVRALPDGLDTRIGDGGVQLSGGQSQRLALARSLLLDPRILVLDEPTSALDGATEQAILTVLAELAHTVAVVLITHRPDVVAQPVAILRLASPHG
ncbi:peptidase domain-containing ABC transporter [Labrys portucalensis]|uniref:Peptidase domain-containing ABC transporter n=1 Tax=Labrys neptuniae TaxID=376174 RepID=A0ABV6ZQW7_9HYPH